MEKLEYYNNHFDMRNVLNIKGLLEDIKANWNTYVSQINQWIQKNPLKKLLVTGIFTVVLGLFTSTANAALIQEYTYQVQNGDNIENIAAVHGVTAQEILDANGLASIEGKTILLPKVQDRTVTATTLNVRSQPGTQSSIIGKYKTGDVVKVTFEENGWAGILINGRLCFVSTAYLSQKQPAPPAPVQVQSQEKEMTVTATSLRVRESASTKSAVLGYLKSNDQVTVISTSIGWAKIAFKGKEAFVSTDYLKNNEPAPIKNNDTSSSEYVIKKGDTFTKIGKALGISAASIQALNPSVNPSKLAIGQKIIVPAAVQIKVTAQIAGIDPEGTFRFITPDGVTNAAKASGNLINELFALQGKTAGLTLEGNRGQIMTLVSIE
jgi:uncharacterized protein YgiM (DUF1202 family)